MSTVSTKQRIARCYVRRTSLMVSFLSLLSFFHFFLLVPLIFFHYDNMNQNWLTMWAQNYFHFLNREWKEKNNNMKMILQVLSFLFHMYLLRTLPFLKLLDQLVKWLILNVAHIFPLLNLVDIVESYKMWNLIKILKASKKLIFCWKSIVSLLVKIVNLVRLVNLVGFVKSGVFSRTHALVVFLSNHENLQNGTPNFYHYLLRFP